MSSKIIFLDIDGTIIDTPRGLMQPSELTRYAVKELIRNGHSVVIASGRPMVLLSEDILSLGASGYLLCNGAYGAKDGEMLFEYHFSEQDRDDIVSFCSLRDGSVWFAEDQRVVYSSTMDNDVYYGFTRGWGMKDHQFTDEYKDIANHMMMTAFKSEEECDEFAKAFSDRFEVARQYGFTSFDVSVKGITKGYGVSRFLELSGYSREDAFAFGDGTNDAEMMLAVANSYAMANGNETTKRNAYGIAPDVLDDGVYKVLVDRGLIKAFDK